MCVREGGGTNMHHAILHCHCHCQLLTICSSKVTTWNQGALDLGDSARNVLSVDLQKPWHCRRCNRVVPDGVLLDRNNMQEDNKGCLKEQTAVFIGRSVQERPNRSVTSREGKLLDGTEPVVVAANQKTRAISSASPRILTSLGSVPSLNKKYQLVVRRRVFRTPAAAATAFFSLFRAPVSASLFPFPFSVLSEEEKSSTAQCRCCRCYHCCC